MNGPATSLTISGYSTALFSTWWFVDDLALLLDCGDGASAALMQKSRKARTVAISHSDRDHLAGLDQFLQLNVRAGGLPVVLYPRDCRSFPALREFLQGFDRFHLQEGQENRWLPMNPGTSHDLGKAKARIEAFANRHMECEPGEVKSLSYRVVVDHHRLKEEFRGRKSEEIAELRERRGEEAIMEFDTETWLTYSGDTPMETAEFWGATRVLIHEATFLSREDAESRGQDLRHSALDEVISLATELEPEVLILGHFSTRYSERQIREAIDRQCRLHRPRLPVFAVMPGEVCHDLLRGRPVWEP